MKFNNINRNRYLTKTPILTWIKVFAYSATALTGVYSTYLFYYKGDEYLAKYTDISKEYSFELKKKSEESKNKPLQRTAYNNYLREKKLYEIQLNEETQKRLEQIKLSSLESPIIIKKTNIETEKTIEKIVPTKNSKSWLNYITFGYLEKKNL